MQRFLAAFRQQGQIVVCGLVLCDTIATLTGYVLKVAVSVIKLYRWFLQAPTFTSCHWYKSWGSTHSIYGEGFPSANNFFESVDDDKQKWTDGYILKRCGEVCITIFRTASEQLCNTENDCLFRLYRLLVKAIVVQKDIFKRLCSCKTYSLECTDYTCVGEYTVYTVWPDSTSSKPMYDFRTCTQYHESLPQNLLTDICW